jgi:hypothetical protein
MSGVSDDFDASKRASDLVVRRGVDEDSTARSKSFDVSLDTLDVRIVPVALMKRAVVTRTMHV